MTRWRFTARLGCLAALLMSCASQRDPGSSSALPATAHTSGEGGLATKGSSAADGGHARDTSSANLHDASVSSEEPAPRPAEPCGQDLDADNGKVRIDLGRVPKGSPFLTDPLAAGPFKVVATKHSVPNPDPALNAVPLTVYAPASDDAAVADAKHPLVMVMPGFGKGLGLSLSGVHPSYSFYSEHLASHGFIVVGMSFVAGGVGLPFVSTENLGAHLLTDQAKNVAEIRAVLDFVLSKSEISKQIDDSKIAIAGHSQGGKLAFFAAAEDARFDLVIGWDPQNAAGGTPCAGAPDTCNLLPIAPICPNPADPSAAAAGRMHELHAEVLVFAARDSGTIPDAHQFAEHFYRGAASPAHLVLFKDASHEHWSDGENPVAKATMRAQLALLLARFAGRTGLDDYLPVSQKLVMGMPNVEQYEK